jgi:hypothetical protein
MVKYLSFHNSFFGSCSGHHLGKEYYPLELSFIGRVPSTSSKSRQLKSQPNTRFEIGFSSHEQASSSAPSKRTSFVPGFPVIQLRPGAPSQSTLKQLSLLRSPGSNCVSPCSIPQKSIIGRFCSRPALS